MSVTRPTVTTAAKSIAQDPGSGAALLLAAGDYDLAIDQAIETFKADRPNLRIVHYTVLASAFRFVLLGTGVILPTTGLDKWIDGGSRVVDVFQPYDITTPDNVALDRNTWREKREPGLVILELLAMRPSSGVLRIEYVTPHVVDASNVNATSLLEADVKAFETLTAAKICEMTARRYVQNTGTSTFQSDSVDRRSQSDIMAKRAKELLTAYGEMVGKGGDGEDGGSNVAAAAAIKKMVVSPSHHRGRLWHQE